MTAPDKHGDVWPLAPTSQRRPVPALRGARCGVRLLGRPAVLLRAGLLAGADDAAVEAGCAARGVWPDALAEGFVWA